MSCEWKVSLWKGGSLRAKVVGETALTLLIPFRPSPTRVLFPWFWAWGSVVISLPGTKAFDSVFVLYLRRYDISCPPCSRSFSFFFTFLFLFLRLSFRLSLWKYLFIWHIKFLKRSFRWIGLRDMVAFGWFCRILFLSHVNNLMW